MSSPIHCYKIRNNIACNNNNYNIVIYVQTYTFKTNYLHYLAWILFLLFKQTIIITAADIDSIMTITTAMIIIEGFDDVDEDDGTYCVVNVGENV